MVKLSTGREVQTKHVNFQDRVDIIDLYMEYLGKGVNASLNVCVKAIKAGTDLKDQDLDSWSTEELYELGAIIISDLYAKEVDKKK